LCTRRRKWKKGWEWFFLVEYVIRQALINGKTKVEPAPLIVTWLSTKEFSDPLIDIKIIHIKATPAIKPYRMPTQFSFMQKSVRIRDAFWK